MTSKAEVTTPATGKELRAQLDITLSDPADMAIVIAARQANANSAAELFSDNGNAGWENHVGTPFYVRRVYWLESSFEDGIGFYAIVEAVNADTGEQVTLTTGSTGVCIQLAKALQMGWLDEPVKLKVADRPTADGYYPQRLVQA